MPANLLKPAVFFTGLAALCWIGAGYVGANALALAVVVLIAAFYVIGGLELHRYRQGTAALGSALDALGTSTSTLADWLQTLPPALRSAVRLRIEGERVSLPGPALTPYLVGLLVLLGMLGTLLGMMTTLRGTGVALEAANDLEAIRTSLAAPVKGLAFAFGTSIAGVAASSMLGLLSALCRRERAAVVHRLDAAIATTLRPHSRTHQREEGLKLLQQQVEYMPAVVAQLQATVAAMQQHSVAASERQLDAQAAFHERSEASQARLAASIEAALQGSIEHAARAHERQMAAQDAFHERAEASSARLVETVSRAVEDLARESARADAQQLANQAAFHERTETIHTGLAASVGQSLRDSVAEGARAANASLQPVVESTLTALAGHAAALHADINATLQRQLDALTGSLQASTATVADLWTGAAAEQRQANAAFVERFDASLQAFGAHHERHARQVVDALASRFESASEATASAWRDAFARQSEQAEALARTHQQALAATAAGIDAQAGAVVGAVRESHLELQGTLAAQAHAAAERADAIATRFERASVQATGAWSDALSQQADLGQALARHNEQALGAAAATFETHAQALVDAVQRSHAQLQADLHAQMQAHAHDTIGEVTRLVHEAAEAPKAAAAVIAELRHSLSESLVRDTAVLDERARLLATVETLLTAVNHAAAEQRTAVDALIANSADALERVAARFTGHVESETGKLDAAADRITAGAIEVASLGDVFGVALQRFGETNDHLATRLRTIETALEQSLSRSDEQLAYYVAQAREVVDLSVLAQKQIVAELQHLAQARARVEPA